MDTMVIHCEDEGKTLAVIAKLAVEIDGIKWLNNIKPHTEDFSYPLWLVVEDKILSLRAKASELPPYEDVTLLMDYEYLRADCEEEKNDPVSHPSHYTQGKVECIDAMEQVFGTEAVKAFCLCNTFKYLFRRKDKCNEEQDVAKSLWYFDRYVEMINR